MGLFAWLASRVAPAAPPDNAVASPLGTLAISEQIGRIGMRLTPANVSAIMLEADTGVTQRLCDLGAELRQKSPQIQTTLHSRETELSRLAWVVEPYIERGAGEATTRDTEIAEAVAAAIEESSTPRGGLSMWPNLLGHLNGGVYYGHAVAETVWGTSGGMLAPLGWRLHSPRRFGYRARDGALCWSDGQQKDTLLADEYPSLFLQHQPRITGDVPAREGLIRLLCWLGLFENWDIQAWLKLAEIAWMPMRVARMVKTSTDRDKAEVATALQALVTRGVLVHGPGVEVELKWPTGSNAGDRNHERLANWVQQCISKAVLGQTLTTDAGERGARSLGEVHEGVKAKLLEYDAECVAATVQRDLVTWIVRYNYGDAPMPRFRFLTEQSEDIATFSAGVLDLARAGVAVPAQWVRDRLGIPQPIEGEETVGAAAPAPEGDNE